MPNGAGLQLSQFIERGSDVRCRRYQLRQQPFAGLARCHLTGRPVQQYQSKPSFQAPQRLADGAWRDPEIERRAAEAATARDREELGKTIEGIGAGHGDCLVGYIARVLNDVHLPIGSLASIRRQAPYRQSRRYRAVQLISVWSKGAVMQRPRRSISTLTSYPLRHG